MSDARDLFWAGMMTLLIGAVGMGYTALCCWQGYEVGRIDGRREARDECYDATGVTP